MPVQAPSEAEHAGLADVALERDRDIDFLAALGPLALVTGALLLACGSARWSHVFVPGSKVEFPAWMAGPLAHLGPQLHPRLLGPLMVLMFAAYVATYWMSDRISVRALVLTIVAVDVILTLAPPLLSADVFGYIGYARLEVVHSLNPYNHVIADAPLDPIIRYSRWHNEVTPYGPLFTVLTYAIVPLGIAASFWTLKVLALVAALAGAALVWRLAGRTAVDQRKALIFFALNPILLVYGLGGAHNDLLLMAIVLTGLLMVMVERSGAAGSLLIAATAIKVTAGLYLPFALIAARDKKRFLLSAAVTTLLIALFGLVVFQGGAGAVASQILLQQKLVATGSIPMQLSMLLGYDHLVMAIRVLALLILSVSFASLIVFAQRTGKWLESAGWTAFVLIVTTAWLTPWYVLWVLPVAAIAGSRRLILSTGVLTGYLTLAYTVLPFLLHNPR